MKEIFPRGFLKAPLLVKSMHKPRGSLARQPPNQLSPASTVAFHTAIATYHFPARRKADRKRLPMHIRSRAERVGWFDNHIRSDKQRPSGQKKKSAG